MISTPWCRASQRRQGLGGAVGQQVDRRAALQVDQDGAVGAAPPQAPIVHAQDARRRGRRLGDGAQQAQQRVPLAGAPSLAARRAPGSPPSARATSSSSARCSSVRRARSATTPGKRSAKMRRGTGGGVAAEAADAQAEGRRAAAPGRVGDGAVVVAVDAAGRPAACRAAGGAAGAGDDEGEAVVGADDLVEAQAGQVRDEQGEAHARAPSTTVPRWHDSPVVLPDSLRPGCTGSGDEPRNWWPVAVKMGRCACGRCGASRWRRSAGTRAAFGKWR